MSFYLKKPALLSCFSQLSCFRGKSFVKKTVVELVETEQSCNFKQFDLKDQRFSG